MIYDYMHYLSIYIIFVLFKAIMNSLHTILTHFGVFITSETWRYSN